MARQLVFIDDSGDPGFQGATSANFVMAAVVFNSQEVATLVNQAISDYRKMLGWQDNAEFKFRKTNKKFIVELLRKVVSYDFEVYAVYINKISCQQMLPILDNQKLYNWTTKELLLRILLNEAAVTIDGRATREHRRRIASYIRHELNTNERKVKTFRIVDSVQDNLIQLADIVAGSINRSMLADKTDSSDYLAILKPKIARIERLDLHN